MVDVGLISLVVSIIALILAILSFPGGCFRIEYTLRKILRFAIVEVEVRQENKETEYRYLDGVMRWHGLLIRNRMKLADIPACHVRVKSIFDKSKNCEVPLPPITEWHKHDLHWVAQITAYALYPQFTVERKAGERAVQLVDMTLLQESQYQETYHMAYARYPRSLYELPRSNDEQNYLDLFVVIEQNKEVIVYPAISPFRILSLPSADYIFTLDIMTASKIIKSIRVELSAWTTLEGYQSALVRKPNTAVLAKSGSEARPVYSFLAGAPITTF